MVGLAEDDGAAGIYQGEAKLTGGVNLFVADEHLDLGEVAAGVAEILLEQGVLSEQDLRRLVELHIVIGGQFAVLTGEEIGSAGGVEVSVETPEEDDERENAGGRDEALEEAGGFVVDAEEPGQGEEEQRQGWEEVAPLNDKEGIGAALREFAGGEEEECAGPVEEH